MGASDDVLPHAREYLRIILFGIGFQIFGMALSGLIRAEGTARVPMIGMMVGALLNILLSGYFVGMVKMGVKGAALATLFSQLMSFLYLASFYRGKKTVFRLGLRDFRLSLSVLRPVFAIGFASFAMTLANSVSGVLVNHVLGSYGGDYAISAFGIINRIVMFAMMPSMVIGQGVQPIIGFNYGARRFDRAIRAINMAISAATLLSISIFFVLYSAPDTFIGVFTSDEDLLNLASEATRTMFLGLYFMGFVMVGSIVFQALGRARQSLVTSLSRPVFFFIPLVLILPYFFQLKGVWLAFPVSDFLTFLLILSFLIPEINRLRRAAREHQSPSEAR
jgi:putative MATE family efflux protein